MNREQIIGTIVIAALVVVVVAIFVTAAVADGWNFRQQCVAAGGYVVQQGSPNPVCVR